MKLLGANTAARGVGLDELPGKSNYFIGNDPKKWRTNGPTYARVRYEVVYPGVDLVYYGNQGRLEYDFVVAPGADPGAIRLAIVSEEQVGSRQKAGSRQRDGSARWRAREAIGIRQSQNVNPSAPTDRPEWRPGGASRGRGGPLPQASSLSTGCRFRFASSERCCSESKIENPKSKIA
jgi:hypothetical protein